MTQQEGGLRPVSNDEDPSDKAKRMRRMAEIEEGRVKTNADLPEHHTNRRWFTEQADQAEAQASGKGKPKE